MRRALVAALALAALHTPAASAWSWPADGAVLAPFVFGKDAYAANQHRGIDVAGAAGSPVRAPVSGTVSFAGTVPQGGKTVTIETADGYSVTLVHLGSIDVSRGAPVAEGAVVGTIGPSGEAEHSQPYVHVGVRITADPHGYVDPLRFLPPRGGEQRPAEPAPAAPAVVEAPKPAAPPVQPPPAPEPAPTAAAAEPGPTVVQAEQPDREAAAGVVSAAAPTEGPGRGRPVGISASAATRPGAIVVRRATAAASPVAVRQRRGAVAAAEDRRREAPKPTPAAARAHGVVTRPAAQAEPPRRTRRPVARPTAVLRRSDPGTVPTAARGHVRPRVDRAVVPAAAAASVQAETSGGHTNWAPPFGGAALVLLAALVAAIAGRRLGARRPGRSTLVAVPSRAQHAYRTVCHGRRRTRATALEILLGLPAPCPGRVARARRRGSAVRARIGRMPVRGRERTPG